MDNPTNINQISTAPAIPLFFDKVNGMFGIGTGTPQGIAHLIKETYDSQNGINMNVGPISSGHSEATNIVRLASGAMVNLCDTVEFTADDHIDFSFAGNYQGMMGCGDIHFYDVGIPTVRFCFIFDISIIASISCMCSSQDFISSALASPSANQTSAPMMSTASSLPASRFEHIA